MPISSRAGAVDYALCMLWCFTVVAAGGLVGSFWATSGSRTAAIDHLRAGRVNWRLFGWMTPPSIAGAVVTGRLSELQLARAIAAILLVAGIATAVQAVA